MFNGILLDLAISALLTALKNSIKNPDRKEKIRKVALKIFRQIRLTFAGDSDFEC